MRFISGDPIYEYIGDLEGFNLFLLNGQPQLIGFLKQFLNLDTVRPQLLSIQEVKEWLCVSELNPVIDVPRRDNEICLVSQIIVDNKVIALYPIIVVGKFVHKIALAKSLYTRIAEAISDQLTALYKQEFYGGDWLFGDKFAQMLIANCVSSNIYDGVKYAHLIEKMEHLSVSTFEGEYFTTGVIVTKNSKPYRRNAYTFKEARHIDNYQKRDWIMADGKTSFFILDSNTNIRYLYCIHKRTTTDHITDFFENYYLNNSNMFEPDFLVRVIGPNEISVSDATGKEFVKVENIWRYRFKKNFTSYLCEALNIKAAISNAIIYYVLKCSRSHISSIIWLPEDCSIDSIKKQTTNNRIKIWNENLNITCSRDEAIIDKVLASDGAIVINKSGDIIYESVFAELGQTSSNSNRLSGTGETAAKLLAQNGLAIKISQDGAIKIYDGQHTLYY